MELALDAGFEGIEVALCEDDAESTQQKLGLVCLDAGEDEWANVPALARDVGIELSSLATGLYWQYSLSSDDGDERAKAMDVSRQLLQAAAAIGVDAVLLIPGCVHATFIPDCPIVPYDVVWERSQAALKELAPLAEELRVHIGVEYVWNMFLLSPMEAARYLDEIGSGHVGFYFDPGNMAVFQYMDTGT